MKKKTRKRAVSKSLPSYPDLLQLSTTNLSGGDLCFFCMFIVQGVFFFFNEVQHRRSPVSIGYSATRKGRSSAAYSDSRNEKHHLL